jgi:hypothetical protein
MDTSAGGNESRLQRPDDGEALCLVMPSRKFAHLSLIRGGIPDKRRSQFRRLLETHGLTASLPQIVNRHLRPHGILLKEGTIVGVAIIYASLLDHEPPRPRERNAQ